MTLRRILPIILIFTVIIASGCSGPVKNTGYLDNYEYFNRVNTKQTKFRVLTEEDYSLEAYFPSREMQEEMEEEVDPLALLAEVGIERDQIKPVLFVVDEPQWAAAHRYTPEKEDAIQFVVRERLYRYLLRQYPHPVRVRYAFVPNDPRLQDYRVLTVETRITDINPGAGWLRYFIGYGAGTSVLQLEGRIYEGNPYDRGTVIAEFALREDHAGYPNGYINPSVMKSSYTIKYAAEQAIDNLAKIIRTHIPPAQPLPGTQSPQAAAVR